MIQTPLPWGYEQGGTDAEPYWEIAPVVPGTDGKALDWTLEVAATADNNEANAKFICKAVNEYESLTQALQRRGELLRRSHSFISNLDHNKACDFVTKPDGFVQCTCGLLPLQFDIAAELNNTSTDSQDQPLIPSREKELLAGIESALLMLRVCEATMPAWMEAYDVTDHDAADILTADCREECEKLEALLNTGKEVNGNG